MSPQPAKTKQILSLALRPRTLSALYGQNTMVTSIRSLMTKRPPSAWMFSGPSGTGKTTTAGILSIAYQCAHMKLWGDPCDECWKRKSSFAIHEINASDKTGVEDIRQVIELARYKPSYDGKRVIILNECQKLSSSAQNSLLDPVEKAAEHLVWIVCTTEPTKIIDTLRKRCVKYTLKTLGITAAEDFLKRMAARGAVTRPLEPLFEQCHLMQINAPRDLLMALEKYASGSSATDAVTGADESGIDSLRVCRALTKGNWEDVKAALKDATPEQARWIRASAVGWLKACLIRETGSAAEKHANGLIELSSYPFDDAAMLGWLWGTLYKICKRYRGA